MVWHVRLQSGVYKLMTDIQPDVLLLSLHIFNIDLCGLNCYKLQRETRSTLKYSFMLFLILLLSLVSQAHVILNCGYCILWTAKILVINEHVLDTRWWAYRHGMDRYVYKKSLSASAFKFSCSGHDLTIPYMYVLFFTLTMFYQRCMDNNMKVIFTVFLLLVLFAGMAEVFWVDVVIV